MEKSNQTAAGSTLTSQGKRYGFTTAGALAHLGEMLSHDEDWDTLTNYDRACIREVARCAERHLPNTLRDPAGEQPKKNAS